MTYRGNSSPQKRTTLAVFLTLLLSLLAFSFWMVVPYLLAVMMGGLIALLSFGAYQRLLRRRYAPKWAASLVTMAVVVVIIAPLTLFAIKAVQQGIAAGQSLSKSGFSFRTIIDRASHWAPVESIVGDPSTFEAQSRTWIQSAGKTATGIVLSIAAQLPKVLLQLALALIACFFFLIDGKKFGAWAADKVPTDSDVRAKLARSLKDTSVSVIWATLAAAAAQAIVMLAAFALLGVPGAFLAGGATFILAWIPILGSVPVWLAGASYLYSQGSLAKVALMLGFGAIAGIVDNLVRPLVLRGRSKIHPLVSLVAIFGGIEMFGITGVFVGPIVAAVLISLLQTWPEVGSRFGLMSTGQPKGESVKPAA